MAVPGGGLARWATPGLAGLVHVAGATTPMTPDRIPTDMDKVIGSKAPEAGNWWLVKHWGRLL